MGELTIAELDDEICSLAARINVATARLVLLVGEFDEREGWAGDGVKSCAHWLSWKCQLGAHAAREQVRVARALRALPLLGGEFGAGRLCYAEVRALTRIAAQDTEADLLELAQAATAAQLERTVAGWRRVEALDDETRAQRRALSWHFDEHGMLHLSGCLDSDEAAVLHPRAGGDRRHPARAAGRPAGRAAAPRLGGIGGRNVPAGTRPDPNAPPGHRNRGPRRVEVRNSRPHP